MKQRNKIRYFIISFLLTTVLAGNVYLTLNIDNHITIQRENTKQVTEYQRAERYKIYKDISDIKSVHTGYTVWTFCTTLFVVFCLLICEQKYRKDDESE